MSETDKKLTLNSDFSDAFDRLDHSGLPPDEITRRVLADGIPQYIVASSVAVPETIGGLHPDLLRRIKDRASNAPEEPAPFGHAENFGPRKVSVPLSARERVRS